MSNVSNLNPSCIELELGLGFDKSEIKATSAQLYLELWLSLGIADPIVVSLVSISLSCPNYCTFNGKRYDTQCQGKTTGIKCTVANAVNQTMCSAV